MEDNSFELSSHLIIKEMNMSEQIVELGDHVKDMVTGFEGIVVVRTILGGSEDRFEVKPPAKDGEMKDGKGFDRSQLEVIEKQKIKFDETKIKDFGVKIGDEVEDTPSGFKGIAVAQHIFLNGCMHISIQPPFKKKEQELPDNHSFESYRIKILKEGKVKFPINKEVEEPKEEPKTPGGPETYTPSKRITHTR